MHHKQIRLLIIQPKLAYYRVEVFKQLGQLFDLTILHSGPDICKTDFNFREIIWPLSHLGPFTYFKRNLNKQCKEFDVVLSEANIRHIDRDIIILNPLRRFKWISWGPGVSSSYTKKYDSEKKYDWVRFFILKHSDANIFYSDYPVKKYLKAGIKRESLYVAPNTVYVNYHENLHFKKDKLLFVGTLYKQKGVFRLLDAYKEVFGSSKFYLPLVIVGGGPQFNEIDDWINRNKLSNSITLTGPIFDELLLEKYFREALVCISPNQAGLSVLASMGYGTPVVTKRDAITGGELFNITDNVNGILYSHDEELKGIMLDVFNFPEKYIRLGENARQFYLKNRQLGNMVKGLADTIFYVMNQS